MLFLVRLTGIAIAGLGISFLLEPRLFEKVVSFLFEPRKVRMTGIIKMLIGLIFLMVAPRCEVSGTIAILGLLELTVGVIISIFGLVKANTIIKWWSKRPLVTKRLVAVLYFTIGSLIVYSV